MLTSLIGTPWLPAIRRHHGGGGYQRAPVPRRAHAASAVAQRRAGAESGDLRRFTGSAPNDDAGYDLPQVLIICANSSLPLISGLEFGHEQHGDPAAGRRAVNQAAATTLTIGGHPVLTE